MTKIEQAKFTARTDCGSLTMDSTHFPVLIATCVGTMTPAIMDSYYELRQPLTTHADEIGAKVVVITDISTMELPAATMRRYIGERAAAVDPTYRCLLAYVVVAPNALVRGIATAIGWVIGDSGRPIHMVPSLTAAYVLTRKLYRKIDCACPRLPIDSDDTEPSR